MPGANRPRPRHRTCLRSSRLDSPRFSRELKETAIATPTINRKKGKTRSVGVHPFHWACLSGQYELGSSPALLTRIIPAMVAPRNKSSDIKRELDNAIGILVVSFRITAVGREAM